MKGSNLQSDTMGLSLELERLTNRLDEVDHEIIQLLATASDDLHAVTSKQAVNVESFLQQVDTTLNHSQSLLAGLLEEYVLDDYAERTKRKFTERQNLKQLWRHCEERRLELITVHQAQSAEISTESVDNNNGLLNVSLNGK